jgi:2'-5' RNA ligase
MRLFVGVELEDSVRRAAASAADALRRELERSAPGLDARWIPAENLHITLVFIGEVRDEQAEAIETVLAPPFPDPVFDVTIGGCGAFPPSGPPRVLWFGVRDGAGPMVRVHDEVQSRLAPLGFEPERRPYSPHLTIARVKDVPRFGTKAVRHVLDDARVALGRSPVAAVTLFRSRLSPRGSTYEPLLRVPLS